jgi:hypothetical protein
VNGKTVVTDVFDLHPRAVVPQWNERRGQTAALKRQW